jgi:hypothetical protein
LERAKRTKKLNVFVQIAGHLPSLRQSPSNVERSVPPQGPGGSIKAA